MRLLLTVMFSLFVVTAFTQRKYTWKERTAMCVSLNEPFYRGAVLEPTDTSKGEIGVYVAHYDTAIHKDRGLLAFLLVDFVLLNNDLFRGDTSIIDFIRVIDYYAYDSTIFTSVDIKPKYNDNELLRGFQRLKASATDRLGLLLRVADMKFDYEQKRKWFSKRMIFTFSSKGGVIDYNFIAYASSKEFKELFYGNFTRMIYTYVLGRKRRGVTTIEFRFPPKFVGFDPIIYDLRGKEFKKFLEEKIFIQ